MSHFLVGCRLRFKTSPLQNVSLETEVDLFKNKRTDETHFHENGFAQRLILIQRQM